MATATLTVKKDRFYVIITYRNEFNEVKRKWIATGLYERGNKRKSEEKMREELSKFESAQRVGISTNNAEGEILFSEFLRGWLKMAKPNLQLTTYGAYQLQVKHISGYFDRLQIKLKDLRPVHIKDFYQHLIGNGKSIQLCEHYHVNIRRALQTAVIAEIIHSNPADKIDRPRSPRHIARFYTIKQVEELFTASEREKYKFDLILKLKVIYGLRRSEVLGLKWSAIDFQNNTITFRHAIVQAKVDGKSMIVAKDRMKNQSSLRVLPLIPFIKNLLLETKSKQAGNKKLYSMGYDTRYEDYVCVDELGRLIKPSTASESFKCFLSRNKMPKIRFHELRHSCASLLTACGFTMKQIQEWLGHSTFNTTADIYSHLDYTSKVSVGEVLNKIFNGSAGQITDVKSANSSISRISEMVLTGGTQERNINDEIAELERKLNETRERKKRTEAEM